MENLKQRDTVILVAFKINTPVPLEKRLVVGPRAEAERSVEVIRGRDDFLGSGGGKGGRDRSLRVTMFVLLTSTYSSMSALPSTVTYGPNGPGASDENEDRTRNLVQWVRGSAVSIGLRCRVHSGSSFYS